jgi:predicted ATP-dependent endonuclease of OLD family
MSKANGTLEKKGTYLQHVSLKNYKSIKDAEIDFKPGLNIVIGKNASGKTNFINGLNTVLNFKFEELQDAEAKIKAFFRNDFIQVEVLSEGPKDFSEVDLNNPPINYKISWRINDNQQEQVDNRNLKYFLSDKNYNFHDTTIRYGTIYKENSRFITLPSNFPLVNGGNISSEITIASNSENRSEFLTVFFQRLYRDLYRLYHVDNEKPIEKELKHKIILLSEKHLKNINSFIGRYSPIKEIRLNHDFIVVSEEKGQRQTIANFYLEFLIDEKSWLPYELLSDGSKRLFYIISEMLANDIYSNHNYLDIILLEEPELGVHPHQLHLLMLFIKEQSRYKQIILTTHSPQVLDIIDSDELDRVIICHYDSKNGTQLRHLSEKEMSKAKKYMKEEAFLSDYWRFSDLEPAS